MPSAVAVFAVLGGIVPAQTRAQDDSSTVQRVINEASAGRQWLLVKNPAHAGGPGRLEQASRTESGREAVSIPVNIVRPEAKLPIIRAGDALIVEYDSPETRVRLGAVAMMPAAVGATFRVRLTFDGVQVNAIALGSGRATLAPPYGGGRL